MEIKKQKKMKRMQEELSTEIMEHPEKRKHIPDQHALCNVPFKRPSSEKLNTLTHDDGSCNVPFKKASSENPAHLKHPEDGLCDAPPKKPSSESPQKLKHKEHSLRRNVPSKQSSKRAQDGKKCSLFARLIDSGIVSDNEDVFYLKTKDKSVMKDGAITRNGVLCNCCNKIFLLAKFEVHAGSTLHRPSANMFLRDGRSLMQCQKALCEPLKKSPPQEAVKTSNGNQKAVETSSSNQDTSRSLSANSPGCSSSQTSGVAELEDTNRNTCEICGDGGQLVLCDGCPSAFHASCLNLDDIPEGDWHCSRCRCGGCGLAVQSKTTEASILSCSQCNIPYHRSCVIENLQEELEGPWFCTRTCRHVFKALRRLVGRNNPLSLDKCLSWMLLRSFKEDIETVVDKEAAKRRSTERKVLGAFKIFDRCFHPMPDSETGIDLLSQIVFNRKSDIRRLDCRRFYTIILMEEEELVSVATIRTHGNMMAEMPFIATSPRFRNQGMCKALMQALETMLRDVRVYKLIIPSVDDKVAVWTRSFGFKLLSLQDRKELSGANIMSLAGTTLLQKNLI